MSNRDIYLIGVGNYTEVIIELAQECGFSIKGLYHYNNTRNGEIVMDIPILNSFDSIVEDNKVFGNNFVVTVGDNHKRSEIAHLIREKGGFTPNLIHPKASISKSSSIGTGCLIHANVHLWTKSVIENDCIIGLNAVVSHHSILEKSCYLTSLSLVGSYCKIRENTFIGLNSVIIPNITIGKNSFIGAKSNVTKSFPENSTLKGNPAKIIDEK